jgi:hypothetical protein
VVAELRFSKTRVYELLNAAEVAEIFVPLGQKPESERQLRELAKLRIEGTHDYDAEAQKAVWQIAVQTAPFTQSRDRR